MVVSFRGWSDAWLIRRMAGGAGLAKGQTVSKDGARNRAETGRRGEEMADVFLLIGNKKYSSWSLRPWLVLKQSGIDFEEQLVALDRPDTAAKIGAFSPSGRVPFLRHGKIEVWESLAICEYLAEAFPAAKLWPADTAARAHARAVSNEMHGGFAELRYYLPMDVSRDHHDKNRAAQVQGQVDRIQEIWSDCRKRHGGEGPFLFGRFSIADGMFAPVATRFRTYGVALAPENAAYVDAIMTLPAMQEWVAAAKREPWEIVYPVWKENA
jgi:glutathione S-transferase